MSASTEVPDIIGGIANVIGLNRLWQFDQHADSEKLKSEQEQSSDEEPHRTSQKPKPKDSEEVVPVSLKKKRGKEQADADADLDQEVYGVPKRQIPDPSAHKGREYEWPMPSSLEDNQAKKKYDYEPTRDEDAEPSKEDGETDQGTSKASFIGSLIPFLNQQRTASTYSSPTGPHTTQLEKENPFERPRSHSSFSQQLFDRPKRKKTQRQYTMPVQGPPESAESPKHKAARSKWVSAAHGLRFPVRRRKQEKDIAKTRGTELITTLAAGAPAAIILASRMVLDERSHHRIPVIVDHLKVHTHS